MQRTSIGKQSGPSKALAHIRVRCVSVPSSMYVARSRSGAGSKALARASLKVQATPLRKVARNFDCLVQLVAVAPELAEKLGINLARRAQATATGTLAEVVEAAQAHKGFETTVQRGGSHMKAALKR